MSYLLFRMKGKGGMVGKNLPLGPKNCKQLVGALNAKCENAERLKLLSNNYFLSSQPVNNVVEVSTLVNQIEVILSQLEIF